MDFFTEFFSWDFTREPEGYMSWQHLLIVTIAFLIAFLLAIFLGKKMRNQEWAKKIKVLKISAILLDGFELIKLITYCIMENTLRALLGYLPLFLCSIPLIVLPVAAFSKGRIQKASLDFVMMFGLLGGMLGTYMAGNIYSIFPVLHFHPLVSLITHSISGFSALYIGFSHSFSLEKKNVGITIGILGVFMGVAAIVNQIGKVAHFQDNYMFLSRADGTPFAILEGWFGSETFGYGLAVALCMWAYMGIFYLVVHLIKRLKHAQVA